MTRTMLQRIGQARPCLPTFLIDAFEHVAYRHKLIGELRRKQRYGLQMRLGFP